MTKSLLKTVQEFKRTTAGRHPASPGENATSQTPHPKPPADRPHIREDAMKEVNLKLEKAYPDWKPLEKDKIFSATDQQPHREVWRVQNERGKGPYQRDHNWTDVPHDESTGRPMPHVDPGFTHQDHEDFEHNNHVFGFDTEEQMNSWFSPTELKALGRQGYKPVKVKASHVWSSGKQAFFRPYRETKKSEPMDKVVVSPGYGEIYAPWAHDHLASGMEFIQTIPHNGQNIHVHSLHDEDYPWNSYVSYTITKNGKADGPAISTLHVKDFHPDYPHVDSPYIAWRATDPKHEGKGLNTLLSEVAIRDNGKLRSDVRVSPATEHIWRNKLPQHPNIKVKHAESISGNHPMSGTGKYDDPHVATWVNKPKAPQKAAPTAAKKVKKSEPLDKVHVHDHNVHAASNLGINFDRIVERAEHLGHYQVGPHKVHVYGDGEDGMYDDMHFIIHDQNNKPIGRLTTAPNFENEEGGYASQHSFVEPEHRGKGIGRALYQAAIQHHGFLSSSNALSPHSDKMWRNTKKLPDVKFKAGRINTDRQHTAEYSGPAPKMSKSAASWTLKIKGRHGQFKSHKMVGLGPTKGTGYVIESGEIIPADQVEAVVMADGVQDRVGPNSNTADASFHMAKSDYNNWMMPSDDDLANEYNWEYRHVKGSLGDIFPTKEHFLAAAKAGKIQPMPDNVERATGAPTVEDVKAMVSHYQHPRDVDRIVHGLKHHSPIPTPIVIRHEDGHFMMGGNTRQNLARIHGITPHVLVVDAHLPPYKKSERFNERLKAKLGQHLEKRSKNVRAQTRNITPEQAQARREAYAKRIGLNPVAWTTSIDQGGEDRFPLAEGNKIPHGNNFGIEHETAHAMMTPGSHQTVRQYQDALGDEESGVDYDQKYENVIDENVANRLESMIDRRAGVGGHASEYRKRQALDSTHAQSAVDPSDEGDDGRVREGKLSYEDKYYRDFPGGKDEHSRDTLKPFTPRAQKYADRFDQGAKFTSEGKIVDPKPSIASVLQRLKSGKLQKGSARKLAPYGPVQGDTEETRHSRQWISDNRPKVREELPRHEGEIRFRAVNKLFGATKHRRNPATGDLEFLLHRGMSPDEAERHSTNDNNMRTSWTPRAREAASFAGDYGSDRGDGVVMSAWIPAKHMHHFPFMEGHDPAIRTYRDEFEVVVAPHAMRNNIESTLSRHKAKAKYDPEYSPQGYTPKDVSKYYFGEEKKQKIRQKIKQQLSPKPATGPAGKKKPVKKSMAAILQKFQDKIPGGKADNKKPSDFDPRQIAMGQKVEAEHTSDPSKRTEITMDHLTEDPRYYDKLKTIEPEHFEKGARGDWQKEGYSIRWDDRDPDNLEVTAHAPDGTRVGEVFVDHAPDKKHIYSSNTRVHAAHQRKGLATAMYRLAEQKTGKKMIRSDTVKGSFENLGVSPQGKALWAGMKKSEPLIEVSSVAVIDPATSAILMGQRSDSGKWTMPGGHANPGESSLVCAMRELREEAGIVCRWLQYLGSEKKMCEDGKVRLIHAYVMYGHPKTTGKYDPDEEVQKWVWIPFRKKLPPKIEANLHSPKNVTLKYLGLQKW